MVVEVMYMIKLVLVTALVKVLVMNIIMTVQTSSGQGGESNGNGEVDPNLAMLMDITVDSVLVMVRERSLAIMMMT